MTKIMLDLTQSKSITNGFGVFGAALARALYNQQDSNLSIDALVCRGSQDMFSNWSTLRLKNPLLRDTSPNIFKHLMRRFWKYNVWHVTTQCSGFWPLDEKTPVVFTIHDLNFLREKEHADNIEVKLNKLQRKIDRSSKIVTISKFVRDELMMNFNVCEKNVSVIYNAGFEKKNIEIVSCSFELEQVAKLQNRHFIFSVGECLKKKNYEVLLPFLCRLNDYHLVIAGGYDNEYGRRLQVQVNELGLKDRVHFLGRVSDAFIHWLYNHSQAVAVPSIAEGFGLPVIEAMGYGKPVFCSTATSLPEVGGNLAFYWPDFAPDAMEHVFKNGMKIMATQSHFKSQLIQWSKRFSWDTAANEYIQLYKSLS